MAQTLANQEPVIEEGEHDWIFDCLITFLKSPRWKTPVVSYIEEHCLIFDNEEENKLEYTTIHHNFFRLVDELLCELVAEMGITREQFKAACESSAANPTHHRIVQQILNVDDFESFKKMMIKKNMQINEIAMQELMKKQPTSSESDVAEPGEAQQLVQAAQSQQQTNSGADEDEEMRLVMEMSRQAQEDADRAGQEEEEMIRQAIEASQKEEVQRAQVIQQEEAKTQAAIVASQSVSHQVVQQQPAPQQVAQAAREEVKQQQQQPDNSIVNESIVSPQDKKPRQRIEANIDPEQKRREDEKLRQLAELKRKNAEAKRNPPVVQADPVVPVKAEPKFDNSKFLEEQKQVISKIRKPKVEEVSAFDDIHSGATFAKEEDPYAGKSFAEVLRMKREKLDAQLKASQPEPVAPVQDAAAAQQVPAQPKATGKDETLEDRKARLQAQRQALLEKRKQAREKELNDYNTSASGASLDAARNSFYAQMIKMDQALPSNNKPLPSRTAAAGYKPEGKPQQAAAQAQQPAQPAPQRAAFNLDDIEAVDI